MYNTKDFNVFKPAQLSLDCIVTGTRGYECLLIQKNSCKGGGGGERHALQLSFLLYFIVYKGYQQGKLP